MRLLKDVDVIGWKVDGFSSTKLGKVIHWMSDEDPNGFPIWIMATPNMPVHGWVEFEMFWFAKGEIRTPLKFKMKGDGKDGERYKKFVAAVISLAKTWIEEEREGNDEK